MMHRWPNIRAHMGPEFIALLDWYTSQRRALECEAEDLRAWGGVRSDLDAVESRGFTSVHDTGPAPHVAMAAVLARSEAP